MKLQECRKCRMDFPATTDYFYRNKGMKNRLTTICKECDNEERRKRYAERLYRKYGNKELYFNRVEPMRKASPYTEKPIKALCKKEIEKNKYKIGRTYEVTIQELRNITRTFKGKLIQETSSCIILKNNCRSESFMKVDLMIDVGIREVK